MRVSDRRQRLARDRLELTATVHHCTLEPLVVEPGERVVASRVETDGHACADESPHLLDADAGVVRIWAERQPESVRGCVSLVRRHPLEREAQLVNPPGSGSGRVAEDEGREVGNAGVEGTLETLVVEGEGALERCTREEERRRHAERAQHGERECGVTGQIVVEGDGDGKPLTSTPRGRRVEEALGGDDVVQTAHESNLTLEELHVMGRDELARRVARPLRDAVIHERNACLPRREPEQKHGRAAKRDAERASDEALGSLG